MGKELEMGRGNMARNARTGRFRYRRNRPIDAEDELRGIRRYDVCSGVGWASSVFELSGA